jgi:GrpB-like predicted nucleotidyltransferase (UPF0157 family)
MPRIVELEPYNPTWPSLFQKESDQFERLLPGQIIAVHHIGSTAIKDICAKPTIDLLPVVRQIEMIDGCQESLRSSGYLPMGENGIPGRRYFTKGTPEKHSVHVHIFQSGHPEIERHLLFVDYLNAHPHDAAAYSRLKQELAVQYRLDPQGYSQAKTAFIQSIDRKAHDWKYPG